MDHFKQYFKSKNQNEQKHSIKILREVNKCENNIPYYIRVSHYFIRQYPSGHDFGLNFFIL